MGATETAARERGGQKGAKRKRLGADARRWRALLELARRGDRVAFGVVYTEAFGYLRARLRSCASTRPLFDVDPAGVEDALQTGFTAALERIEGYDRRRAGATWLWMIVRNAAVTALRKRRGRPEGGSNVLEAAEPAAPDDPDPAGAAESVRRARAVERLREGLSDRERAVFESRFVRGEKYRDVAAATAVAEGAVAGLVHRLRKRLRRLAAEPDADEPTHPTPQPGR